MERNPSLSRRDFWRLGFMGAGAAIIGGSALAKYLKDNAPPEGVDENFIRPVVTKTPFQPEAKATQTHQNTQTSQSTEVEATAEATTEPTIETTPENKPLVDQFKIAEKIDLSSGDPMEWLLVTNDNKAILTPSAKPYAYTAENEENNVFDWRNLTTYSYLEENKLPVVWGHSGLPSLFFDYWANFLRKPGENGYVATRADAQKAMLENIIGASIYMLQSPDAALLPTSPEGIGLLINPP